MRDAHVRISFGFVVVAVLLHAAGALFMPCDYLWGLDILGFCRWWHAAVFAAVAAATLTLRQPKAMAVAEATHSYVGKRLSSLTRAVGLVQIHALLLVSSLTVLLLVPTKYSGGDSHWMHTTLPLFLVRAPLSTAVLRVPMWLGMLGGLSHEDAFQTAVSIVGALSICGLFQLFLLTFGDRHRAVLFLAASLASYGISRLLPGYIETYGVYLLFLVLFECALVRYCLTEKGLLLLLLALVLLIFAHIQALVVIPGTFLVSVLIRRKHKRVWRCLVLWLVFGAVLLVAYPEPLSGITLLVRPASGDVHFWSLSRGRRFATPLSALLSVRHWTNVANVHALLSSVGVGVLLAGLALWWREKKSDSLLVVSAVNYALFLAGTVLYYNFHHPIERDWDMFGPGALLLLVLAAALWRRLPADKLKRTLLIILPVAACITALWLAQQAGLTGIAPPPESRVGFALPG